MIQRAMLVIAAVTLAGCAARPATYARLDASPEQHRRDATSCTNQARTRAPVPDDRNAAPSHPGIPEASSYGLGRTEGAARLQASLYDRCMKSRGYARTV